MIDEPMPWCDRCQCYHHTTATCITTTSRTALAPLFRECGQALHGTRWRLGLADDLGIDERTIRRWAVGYSEIPDNVWTDLHRLLTERCAGLNDLVNRVQTRRD